MITILNVKMPESEKEDLQRLALSNDRTMSSMVRVLIKEELKRADSQEDHNE